MSDLTRARELAHGALASLERSRERVDDLNVYPVPDGDTGTNMTLTARSVVEELDATQTDERLALLKEITRAALMGARGNSGVILSQIVRGAAEALARDTTVAEAFRSASDAAYRAVRQPVEGTMLTVIRELAEEAERNVDAGHAELLNAVVRHGEGTVTRTQEQLDVLREAGVVDAGGAGLLELVRGLASAVSGEPLPAAPPRREELSLDAIHLELSRYRYCTTFVIEGRDLDAAALEPALEQLGDSLLVVGDSEALKVHVHTDDPGRALGLGTAVGVIDRVEIANMHEQTVQREERLLEAVPDARSAVVAVVAGEGNRELFESFGAHVIEGGQSMNPSVGELSAALGSDAASEFVVLPNNSNVIGAAEQAVEHVDVTAVVLPTHSMQEGLSALVAFDPSESAEDNVRTMQETIDAVVTGEVTVASRTAQLNGLAIEAGDFLGLAADEAVASGATFDDVAWAVVERLLAEPRAVLTLLTGSDAPDLDGLLDRIRTHHPDVELDVQAGGQPHYPLLLSAE
ncbi:MAG: DAK2 domain-containing protein [Gaiellaceae bacterium]